MKNLPVKPLALLLDFDGVFTNNKVFFNAIGEEFIVCDRSDGHGIKLIRDLILVEIVTLDNSDLSRVRAQKLGIKTNQGVTNKSKFVNEWANRNKIPLDRIWYCGNDVNDIGAMQLVGSAFCPADAHPATIKMADFILTKNGGDGAVRELCDMVLLYEYQSK